MEHRAVVDTSSSVDPKKPAHHYEGRNVWILTAYGISGLAIFGIIAYYVSNYVAH
ncbi:MAG: hypothetical protein H0X25_01965 [Acidobacteriales bacterium]|nr:hypothetical protein [Terriglobales bacterium]